MKARVSKTKQKVPVLDLARQLRPLKKPILKAWSECLDSGHFILGPQVEALESDCARFLGCGHAVAVHSGTDALVIGLRALGVGPGDEVLTTAFSFFATAEAITLVGAKPVFCDIDSKTYLMDLEDARRRMNSRVKAILPVHLYGLPQDLEPLRQWAWSRGVKILEDACQAFGARTQQGACGTLGEAAAFSFYPTKNLGAAGDAGLLTTQDLKVAEMARSLRNHGSHQRYYHETVGYCSRMDELQAAVLRIKLPHLKAWTRRRQEIARRYWKGLLGLGVVLPIWDERCVWHQFSIRVEGGKRDVLAEFLKSRGIGSSVFYPLPLHLQKPYLDAGTPSLPKAETAAKEVLCLPIHAELENPQVDYVIRCVREFFAL